MSNVVVILVTPEVRFSVCLSIVFHPKYTPVLLLYSVISSTIVLTIKEDEVISDIRTVLEPHFHL